MAKQYYFYNGVLYNYDKHVPDIIPVFLNGSTQTFINGIYRLWVTT